jgi:hypothetical protein
MSVNLEERNKYWDRYDDENNMHWNGVPNDATCKACRIKGRVPGCPWCEGTGRSPIPLCEVMGKRGYVFTDG